MKKLKYIFAATLAATLASCDNFLDVKPVGKMIPTEVSQFENILNNSLTVDPYFMMDNNRSCFYAAMADNLTITENLAKYQYTATFPNLENLAAYIFYSPVLNPISTPFTWTYSYKAIGYFNNVIDGVTAIDSESAYAKGVIAQARLGRAWQMMNMALCYGPMYQAGGANDTKVVPYRLSGDPTVGNGDLNTTAEIFELAKADLDYACENCPNTVANHSRADRACAYALRAEYYMYTRDWQNMLADAQKAWELAVANSGSADKLIYNYNDFYYEALTEINPPEGCSPEPFMTLRGPDTDFEQTTHREILLYRSVPSGTTTTKYVPSEDWKSIFDFDHDLRCKKFFFIVEGYHTTYGDITVDDGLQINDYRSYNMQTTEGITYPQLLLEKAEAEARTGNTSAALQSLNLLRKYRYNYGDGVSTDLKNGSSMSADQLLNEILTERRRELPLVSFQRMLDLKRYAYDTGKPWSKTVIEHKIGTKTYSKPITDAYFQSLPIDNAIIEYNPQWGLQTNATEFAPYSAW